MSPILSVFKCYTIVLFFSVISAYSWSNDCVTANLIISEEGFTDSPLLGSFSGASFSGETQCVGPGGSDDVWYTFVAVATDHGIQATGFGDLDLVIEVFDACGGALLACRNGNGAGGTETAIVSGLSPGSTYFYRLYHGDAPAVSTDFTTAVAHIPLVELVASDCGATDLSTNDIIRATPPSNTTNFTNYQFRFVELEAPFNTYTITSFNGTNPNFLLEWFPQLEYGRSYEVSVRVRAIVPAFGDFGNTCTITMLQDVPIPVVETQYVNGFFNFCETVGATKVALASEYRWTFLNLTDFSSVQVTGLSDSRLLNLYRVPGLEIGRSYLVGVQAVVAGEVSGLELGLFEQLNTNPLVSNTGLNSLIYPCGQTYASSTFLQATEVCRAESYTWRFTNTSTPQAPLIYTRDDGSRFVDLDFVFGLIEGDSYDVEVLAAQGGAVGDYSTVCNITIGPPDAPSSPPVELIDSKHGAGFNEVPSVFLAGQPTWEVDITRASSGSNVFNITLSSEDLSQSASLYVYDLNGRLVESVGSFKLHAGANTPLNLEKLPLGIYLLQVGNETDQKTMKILIY